MTDLRKRPESVVPAFLYLEDGRIVPVCVVKANQSTLPARTVDSSKLLADSLEGGSPIFVEAQGQRRMGSVGCIVSDGIDYFGLTNRHVAGNSGRDVKAVFNGIPSVVGVTESSLQLGERPFADVYQNFPGRNTVVHLDAGLVKITDVCKWRATVNGKVIQDMIEFSADTASLDWIGFHVVAHGAVSGDIAGEIRALFYRYKSMGGREYISEFLIGSRTNSKHDEQNGNPKRKTPADSGPQTPLMTMPGIRGACGVLIRQIPEDVFVRWRWNGVGSGSAMIRQTRRFCNSAWQAPLRSSAASWAWISSATSALSTRNTGRSRSFQNRPTGMLSSAGQHVSKVSARQPE